MNRKRYFNEIKKEICLHQLFSKLHNYFSRKSPHTSIHYLQHCTNFWNPPLKKLVYCFRNHFLTSDFTSSSQLKRCPSSVPLVLGTGGNHLEPDLSYTVDAAALKIPGIELHLLLLHLCEAWRRVEEVSCTHLAQTFRNPRTLLMYPTLSLEIPKATAISFCLIGRFSKDQFFNAMLMKLINCSHRPSTSCLVTQICLPQFSSFEPPYPASDCTHINIPITINGLHSSVNFNWRNFILG